MAQGIDLIARQLGSFAAEAQRSEIKALVSQIRLIHLTTKRHRFVENHFGIFMRG